MKICLKGEIDSDTTRRKEKTSNNRWKKKGSQIVLLHSPKRLGRA